LKHRQIVAGGFLVATGDPSAILEPVEQSFDLVPFPVDRGIVRPRIQAVAARRDQHDHARGFGDGKVSVGVLTQTDVSVLLNTYGYNGRLAPTSIMSKIYAKPTGTMPTNRFG